MVGASIVCGILTVMLMSSPVQASEGGGAGFDAFSFWMGAITAWLGVLLAKFVTRR